MKETFTLINMVYGYYLNYWGVFTLHTNQPILVHFVRFSAKVTKMLALLDAWKGFIIEKNNGDYTQNDGNFELH